MIDDTNLPEAYGPTTEVAEVPQEILQNQALEQQQQQEQPVEQPKKNKSPQENFAAIRQKMEALERERDAAVAKLQERDNDFDIALGPDDIAEGKHLSRVQKEIKKLKEELAAYKTQTVQATTEARIKAQYSDFDAVVTSDTISQLTESYPELAATLKTAPDLYTQAVSAYTLIKKLGIVPENAYAHEKNKIQSNSHKPRPSSSVAPQHGDSPLTKANAFAEGLTDDLKTQLWKEMNSSRKGY